MTWFLLTGRLGCRSNLAKQSKVTTATDLWVQAVNNWGGFGLWAYLEATNRGNAEYFIRSRFVLAPTRSGGGLA